MKKLLIMVLCLVLATSAMVGCSSQETLEDDAEQVAVEQPTGGQPAGGDIAMGNTFEGTITNIELDTDTDVIIATIEPNEGEEILSVGNLAEVGLIKDHSYEIGDTVTVAYGQAFSDEGNIAFDNATIEW